MTFARRLVSIALTIVVVGCGSTASPTAPTSTPPGGIVSLLGGDIVYHRSTNGATQITIVVGTGSNAQNSVFECHVFTNASDDNWRCGLPARLQMNQDYWVYIVDDSPMTTPLGLKGGSVLIRGHEVTRTIQISAIRESLTAGLFTIIDASGAIR